MSEPNSNVEERRKKTNKIYTSVIKQIKEGHAKEAIQLLKRGREQFPQSKSLQKLQSQINQKLIAKRIKQLESDAVILLQSGNEDEAHAKFREIFKLDPSRTDLKESIRQMRKECVEEFNEKVEKIANKRLYAYITIVSLVFLILVSAAIAWDNKKQIKDAEKYIEHKSYPAARAALNECGWFMAGKKKAVNEELKSIVEKLVDQANQLVEKEDYENAIATIKKAANTSIDPTSFNPKIKNLQKLQKDMEVRLAAKAEAERKQKKAQAKANEAKNICVITLGKARSVEAQVFAPEILQKANNILAAAEKLYANNEFAESERTWGKAAIIYEETLQTTIQIREKRNESLLAKNRCQNGYEIAKDINGDVEARELMQEAQKIILAANIHYEEKHFTDARDAWVSASNKYAEAVEIARQSPSYKQAQIKIKKWMALELGLEDRQIRRVIGVPNYISAASDSCVYYYQDPPMTSAISPEKLEIVEPQFGCVFFKDISYKKMMTSFQTKRSKKLEKVNLAYRRARDNARTASSQFAARIESDHRNNISKIEKEYNNARQNLSGGLTPLRPVYVVTEWLEPNPDKVAVLLQSDAASEDTKIEFTEKWQDKTRWRRLPINGRKKDVLNTLGDPLDIETSSNGEQIMHYGNIREYGIVVLKMRGNDTLRVNYWKEPLGPEFTKSKADTVFGRR